MYIERKKYKNLMVLCYLYGKIKPIDENKAAGGNFVQKSCETVKL